MPETETAPPPTQPLFYKSLRPLDSASHATLRFKGVDFAFAEESPSIPIVISEFAEASRHYPIVFAASDATPLVVLGRDRRNLFLENGAWSRGAYVPAFARRYPFGYLRLGDSARFILGIDVECEGLTESGGEPLFENGRPAAITQRALGFCEAFRGEAESTLAFVRALEGRGLLVDRHADAVLPDGRSFSVDGFKVVDAERYAALDGATLVEWHARGWLALVTLHLSSLDRFRDLLSRRSTRPEAPAADAIGDEPALPHATKEKA
ncbi:SapC family protein [Sphingomonas sp. DT-207]|uniref:SapC family protein n=1 Tax=Sphingomonas sp. DT-207 TaxID=3396167 RepID=UPI003F1D6AF0